MKMQHTPFHGNNVYNGLKPHKLTFKKAVKKVMKDRSSKQFMVEMENMIRKTIREELDRVIIQPQLSSSWSTLERPRSETPSSRSRFKLGFINSPPSTIFTGAKIEAKDRSPLTLVLMDTVTNSRVISGPLSSSRVQIVPLNADFTEESWTVDVFKGYIVKQREGKRPLLTGDLTVTLKEGVGVIAGVVSFSDNSSWTRSKRFRLGARLTGGGAVEARSEAFKVKDQRGESYKKHHPPYPGDEVWRLEKIARVSAKRLAERKIITVKDFRRWYTVDADALYNLLGGDHIHGGGISKRTYEAVVSHAMECVLDEAECYIYNTTAPGVSLIFNSVYEVIKVCFSDGTSQNPDQLPAYQLDELKREAYQNISQFRTYVDVPQRSLQCTQTPGLQHNNFQGVSIPLDCLSSLYLTATNSMVQPEMMLMNYENSPATTSYHIDRKVMQRVSEHDPVHSESQTVATRDCLENEENTFAYHQHHDFPLNWSPGAADLEQQLNSFCVSVSGTEEAGTYDVRIANINVGSPRGRWCKVKAAFKIREVWKLTTARKRGKACKNPCLLY
ncbi:hypothetical protein N665_0715s0008 [Sinapis alba]|nr:hypothetical protein N665_0715s0008 [Sinapis alba]